MDTYQDLVGLESNVLNINDIIQSVTSASCGAVSTFIGTTRDNFEDKKVIKLEYEAYEPMALKQMRAVCNKIRSQWSVEKIAIYHRLGEVPVKEASIVIAISSPHRQESLLAVQYAIDAVKTSVPIWKKEIYAGHRPQWKENKECAWSTNNVNTIDKQTEYFDMGENSHIDHDYGVSPSDEHLKINPDEIQIKADDAEIKRRIEAFISLKKNSDTSYKPYIHNTVGRVYNQWSHQSTQSSLPIKSKDKTSNHTTALEERLCASEQFLGINKPVPKDVYERLKNIEDRLLQLECISPEYKFMWKRNTQINVDTDDESHEKEYDSKDDSDYATNSDNTTNKKRVYSTDSEDSACVCNHTSNDQNETPMAMIEPSVLTGTYDTGVPVRTVGLLYRGGFYDPLIVYRYMCARLRLHYNGKLSPSLRIIYLKPSFCSIHYRRRVLTGSYTKLVCSYLCSNIPMYTCMSDRCRRRCFYCYCCCCCCCCYTWRVRYNARSSWRAYNIETRQMLLSTRAEHDAPAAAALTYVYTCIKYTHSI
ncbi:unnamed protein product [Trichogramma brassicae]|uniref:Molybdopterin synthase catalytic subunit n=1 Tax=Trichogramma brassicae TaxID=86971 RepID=A0A6H5IL98_9HYME|nr:unnamed protein product [Trichogramma brassicae]